MVVLALACEEPMHPYRMQQLIKARGKDRVANVSQRNSVYQTIDALLRAELIRVRETASADNRPERTVYEATEAGREALLHWVREALARPAREFPDFPAALSLLGPGFTAPELAGLLEQRATALSARLREHEQQEVPAAIPRLFLLEEEYMVAVLKAELGWLRTVSAELRSGKLKFPTATELRKLSGLPGAPSEAAMQQLAAAKKPRHPGR